MSLMLAAGTPWLLVVVTPLLTRLLGRRVGWVLAAGLLATTGILVSLRAGSTDVYESLPWLPTIDVALRLRLDGLSFLFALVVLLVGAVVMIYSTAYVRQERPTGFYALMTAFAAAMLTLVLADDLVVLFVAWELTTLCSYLLILRSGPAAGPPATRTLLVTAAGGLSLLGAVSAIVVRTGTTELTAALAHPAWAQDPVFSGSVAVLVALAAMTKSAQLPFHSWLPDAMVAPAPVSAYLHAAAMVKAGIYLLMLFAGAASHAPVWPVMLIVVGLVTAVMGGLFALQRTDLKELLAYSTVSQLGLLVAVIGVGTTTAMLAASVHVVAHALFKSAGFMSVGLLETRTGTRDLRELSGLARSMPWDAAMLALAAISMAGVAPALGFVSKELIIDAFLTVPGGAAFGLLALVALVLSAVLTVAYSARIVVGTLLGPRPERRPRRWAPAMTLAVSSTALGGLLAGLTVGRLDGIAGPAAAVAARARPADVYSLSLWHGINAPLALSTLAIVLGALVATVWSTRTDRWLVGRRLFPVDGAAVTQRAQDVVIAAGRRVGDLTRSDAPAAHLTPPIALVSAAGLAVVAVWPGLPRLAGSSPVDAALLVVLAVGVVTMVRARNRLMGVIAAGVVGFSVMLWFFVLGASDVALTQLLVEILTVVVMVFVIRRMAPRFHHLGRRPRLPVVLMSLGAGVTATLAALAFTGHRPLSEVGEYYLREAEEATGGTNVVNTILVDFRALDTLGELVVLAIGAVTITSLLTARRPAQTRGSAARTPLVDPHRNAVFLAVLDRPLVPVMLLGSVYALLRGHNAPGGGFIAALLAAAALAVAYLSAPTDEVPRVERPYLAIAAAGIVVAVGTGLAGLVEGSFLRPIHLDVVGLHVTTALIFDIGVYLAVLGFVLAAVNLLGLSPSGDRQREAEARTASAAPRGVQAP